MESSPGAGDNLTLGMKLILNGQTQEFNSLSPECSVLQFVEGMKLQGDRVAVELNGEIVSRKHWAQVLLKDGDKLEIVHFVGGG